MMTAVPGSGTGTPLWVVLLAVAAGAAAAGFFVGRVVDGEALIIQKFDGGQSLRLVIPDKPLRSWAAGASYNALGSLAWRETVWGRDCAGSANLSSGQKTMCQLPSIWKNCTQGIYIDIGTNVGGQIRKLYNPWQFPGAGVLGLFNQTFGRSRSRVCAIGVEANPVHTPYLNKLNAYFKRKGYQAIVLTETAASINTSKVTLHQDHGSPVEWGASMATGAWQKRSNTGPNEVVIPTLDVPAFLADIVRPLVRQIQRDTGVRPAIGMKIDAEGAEYALLPAMITNGALCDLSMIYLEPHGLKMRDASAAAVDMTIAAMESAFSHMRKANPRCRVNYTHLDDESFLHADTQVPLPP